MRIINMRRVLFFLLLFSSTCLYSSSYRVFIKSSGNYDVRGKKFFIAIKDSSVDNSDGFMLQTSHQDYLDCAKYIARALELQGAIGVNSPTASDFIVKYEFDGQIKDKWPISGGSYTSASPYTGGVLMITRNRQLENVAPVTFRNGRVVSQVFSHDHRQITVSSAELVIKAHDSKDSLLWTSAISLKSDVMFSYMASIMMFSSLGRLGTRINNQDFAISDEEPAYKVFCNLDSKEDQLIVNPECSASQNENLRFIIKSSGKTFVGITNNKKLLKFYRIEDHRAVFTSNGKYYNSMNGFSLFSRTRGNITVYFEFNDDIDVSVSSEVVIRKNGKDILTFSSINC